MPARQQVTLQPPLALMLAEHFHDAAVRGKVVVPRIGVCVPGAVGNLKHVLPAV